MLKIFLMAVVAIGSMTIRVIPGYEYTDTHGYRVTISDTTIVTVNR